MILVVTHLRHQASKEVLCPLDGDSVEACLVLLVILESAWDELVVLVVVVCLCLWVHICWGGQI